MENVKFSREEMHKELRMALYQTVRCIGRISREDVGLQILSCDDSNKHGHGPYWLLDADSEPDDFAFDPKDWEIVQTMDRLYDYAVHGVARVPIYQMADETEYTMAAAYVHDFQRMALIEQLNGGMWIGLGKCHFVTQVGAARVALDGGERFFGFDRETPDSALTIRELALLAGMEESSVRNAAVKGKPGALKTYQEDGNTLVARDDALEWLKGRKGFVPTTFRHELGEIDLVSHAFASLNDIDDFMASRLQALGLTPEDVAKRLKTSLKGAKNAFGLYFTEGGSRDAVSLERLAKLLGIESDVFSLRVREAANQEEARKIRKELADLTIAREAK